MSVLRISGFQRILGGFNGILSPRSNIGACHYHSKHGVYGCKPQKESTPHKIPQTVIDNRIKEAGLYQLATAYRQHGHRKATLDPLNLNTAQEIPELDTSLYGLSSTGSEQHNTTGILYGADSDVVSTQQAIQTLQDIYCGTLSAEFQHLPVLGEREWFAEKFEQSQKEEISNDTKTSLAKLMLKSQAFDNFLASKFTSVKRYGGEGAESAMVFYDRFLEKAAKSKINDVIMCIAHRGRLNLLTCLLEYPPVVMFMKMKGMREFPSDVKGLGDVLSHLSSSVDLKYGEDTVHATMLPNSSHLEAVNPVAMGKTRARQQSHGKADYSAPGVESSAGDGAVCLMIHGDASFSGQGVIAETFAMSSVPHFNVGGSVHLIINNQIGFTTGKDRGSSSQHCSDVGKMVDCPVIHVNADYPEDVLRACDIALEYRQTFHKDVIVDYVCYRRWGHNELDEPAFTQPHMYDAIRSRRSIPDTYVDQLVNTEEFDKESLLADVALWQQELQESHQKIDTHTPKAQHLDDKWSHLVQASDTITAWDTGVQSDILQYVGAKSVQVPDDLTLHQTLARNHVPKRLQMLEKGEGLDWATAESVALGSLLYQGYNVRLCGQDVGRGTFSHRHVMLVDQDTEAIHIPLNNITDTQTGFLEVCNSILSEEAVLGFEYGMSVENPNMLAVWEAQFGDFFNGAQIIIDTLITSGETKWLLQSSLVMLLPHGMDGAGPEHSSARVERFLQLTDSKEDGVDGDDVNFQVVNPTTPAQYFHLLRRQMVRNYRKPLVVVAPKGMLRHPSCVSALSDLGPGTTFRPVLGDPKVKDAHKVKRVVIVSGKHYYTLEKERETRGITDTAILRLESLCPFPAEEMQDELKKYPNATDFIWSQEEHRNQGAWSFVSPRFANIVGKKLRYVGRDVSATPATGVAVHHQQQNQQLVDETFS